MPSLRRVTYSHPPAMQDPAWPGWQRLVALFAALGEVAGFDVMETAVAAGFSEDAPAIYNFIHARAPLGPLGLVARHAHRGPFWQIDAAPRRWELEVARRPFLPGSMEQEPAEVFYHYWRDRFFGDATYRTRREGFALVSVGGALQQCGEGQYCTPLEMVEAALRYEPDRPILVSLDPKRRYSESEFAALAALDEGNRRVTVRIGDSKRLLRTCDYVVTQSAAMALDAHFFAKTVVLFAQVDAHHIALDARKDGCAAFEAAFSHAPDHRLYVTWFLRDNALNVSEETAIAALGHRLHALGWPVDLDALDLAEP